MASLPLAPSALTGDTRREDGAAPIPDSAWHVAQAEEDGLLYRFPAGTLAGSRFLTSDVLLDGNRLVVFIVHLQEGAEGPKFGMSFALLAQCAARIRIPLEAVNQNCWMFPREGAWLKPLCHGDIVNLQKVDRMTLTIMRKSEEPARWCMTPFTATTEPPPLMSEPLLPKGPLLDPMGQSALHTWPAKSHSSDEVTSRLQSQLVEAPNEKFPADFSRWGGWQGKRFRATGFFRTEHDGRRWWLVDPDGCAFWSAGMDCVRFTIGAESTGIGNALAWTPELNSEFSSAISHTEIQGRKGINFLRANFIRAFGAQTAQGNWAEITLGFMRKWRFNTVANWSEWEIAREAGFPYVRPLQFTWKNTPMIFRDFPDVFHPSFAGDVKAFGEQLLETRDDPAFIGYFLMNEPTWGFATQTPAEGMWLNTPQCATRDAFIEFIRARHEGKDAEPLAEDFTAFSAVMAEKLFKDLSDACRGVDPRHLNLGARYYTAPPDWAVKAMQCFDVFSINCYQQRVRPEWVEKIVSLVQRPVLVGEWHFGALDAGLPASGIGRVRDQEERGHAYRYYVENAAALPGCVGVHWFTLYDQSAIGRFDGENYNIGFLDVCNRPYEPLADAARLAHERMYRIADGECPPLADAPEYLPMLFM